MELKIKPGAFSELIGVRVHDSNGRRLGRVYEVRGHWQSDGSIVVDELLIGSGGLRKRLRGPAANAQGIPWVNVIGLGRDRIVVRI